MPGDTKTFLTADWRYLAILNYEIEPTVLRPYVPTGTELDQWNGKTYVSMVGFLFLKTRVLGVPIPFHRNFEEVNLRFYVRRVVGDEVRRGVVFIREFVPRRATAWTANVVYGENYMAVPMTHLVRRNDAGMPARVEYSWRHGGRSHGIAIDVCGEPHEPAQGSGEEFITEHYWGYARRATAATEYRVEHPRWRIWRATAATLDCDAASFYGREFVGPLACEPASAFLVEGSRVAVYRGKWIDARAADECTGLPIERRGDSSLRSE